MVAVPPTLVLAVAKVVLSVSLRSWSVPSVMVRAEPASAFGSVSVSVPLERSVEPVASLDCESVAVPPLTDRASVPVRALAADSWKVPLVTVSVFWRLKRSRRGWRPRR
jgi:hypothetical protein